MQLAGRRQFIGHKLRCSIADCVIGFLFAAAVPTASGLLGDPDVPITLWWVVASVLSGLAGVARVCVRYRRTSTEADDDTLVVHNPWRSYRFTLEPALALRITRKRFSPVVCLRNLYTIDTKLVALPPTHVDKLRDLATSGSGSGRDL